MEIFVFLLFLAALVYATKAVNKSPKGFGRVKADSYYCKQSLFSVAELEFLEVLRQLTERNYDLACKVRLADLFDIKKEIHGRDWLMAFNQISAKHVDFLILDRRSGRPIIGIELDDASHRLEHRQKRDAFVDAVFEAAGLPILHVPVQHYYDARELERMIAETIDPPPVYQGGV